MAAAAPSVMRRGRARRAARLSQREANNPSSRSARPMTTLRTVIDSPPIFSSSYVQ